VGFPGIAAIAAFAAADHYRQQQANDLRMACLTMKKSCPDASGQLCIC